MSENRSRRFFKGPCGGERNSLKWRDSVHVVANCEKQGKTCGVIRKNALSEISHFDSSCGSVRFVSIYFRMLALYFLFTLVLFSNAIWLSSTSEKGLEWRKPGCHKVGHTRKVDIGGCISFDVTTNACRGFCESWAVPSDPRNVQITQPVTSTASCCNIMETEPIEVRVMCDSGIRTFIFKSAVTCSCYHCKKD